MRRFSILLFCLCLSACGTSEATTTYVPPAGEGGRMCTNQCRLAQDYCNEACDTSYRACITSAQRQALTDYDKYSHEQLAAKLPLDLEYSDFVRVGPCNVTQKSCYNACESNFGMCYTNCGGKKEVTPACQFLCF